MTFSAADDAGAVVAQVQTMARANDPLYELAFRVVGSRAQDRICTHVLSALAERLDVAPLVEVRRSLVARGSSGAAPQHSPQRPDPHAPVRPRGAVPAPSSGLAVSRTRGAGCVVAPGAGASRRGARTAAHARASAAVDPGS